MIRIQKFYYLMLKIIIYIDYLYIHIYIYIYVKDSTHFNLI